MRYFISVLNRPLDMCTTEAARQTENSGQNRRTIRADIRFELPDDECPLASAGDETISTHMILEDRCYVVSENAEESGVEQRDRAVNGCCPCVVFHRYDCVPAYESADDDHVTVTTYLDDRKTLETLIRDLQEVSNYVSLQRLVELEDEHFTDLRSVDLSLLSDAQEVALSRAIEAGYYDDPRRIDFETLAGELEITKPTLSKRLRIAESKLLVDLLDE